MLEVVRLTFAPTLAPVEKLPVAVVRTVEFINAVPIVSAAGVRFAVDVALATLIKIEFAKTLAVELPTWRPVVVKLTLAPTLAPVEKLPVAVVRTVEFTWALTVELRERTGECDRV
jgi:hypothetical protein